MIEHTCAIKDNGNNLNVGEEHLYKLGAGYNDSIISTPVSLQNSAYNSFIKIAGETYSTCGITIDNQILCWGYGQDGRSGK